MRLLYLLSSIFLAATASAEGWYEPKRGSDERSALMDAIRPHVEWQLGQPIQFVVGDLRVSGDVAFGVLNPQRTGGAKIELYQTPGFQRGEIEPDIMDGVRVDVLYKRLRKTWVAVHHAIGATDVWYSWEAYCAEYRTVLPEFCP